MKKLVFYVIAIAMITNVLPSTAKNRWNISAGGSISHVTGKLFDNYSNSWGGGAFLGAGYEINFNTHWNLNPQIEIDYINNGNVIKEHIYGEKIKSEAREFLNLNIPVIASFRFSVSDYVGLRFGVGPYLQESLAGWKYKYKSNTEKERMSGSFQHRFNVGIQGEAAVETGNHLSYMFRVNYPFARENWMGKTLTLSLGVRYSF